MRHAIETLRFQLAQRQNRPFVIAALATLLLGMTGMMSPLDDGLRVLRNQMHLHAARGEVVVVTVDEASIRAQGEWPWSRTKIAELVNQIDAGGARQIAFEHPFEPSIDAAGNAALAEAFRRLPEKPVIAADVRVDQQRHGLRFRWPDPALARHAQVAALGLFDNGFGRFWQVDNKVTVDGQRLPSIAAILGGTGARDTQRYWIDYSTRASSIPQISAHDVLAGKAGTRLHGRWVLISSSRLTLPIPGTAPMPPAIIHALAAETMRAGPQRDLGWGPAYLIGFLISLLLWRGRRFVAGCALGAGLFLLIICPIWLETQLLFGSYLPGLALICAIATARLWRSYRRGGERTNTLSGLPNLLALRDLAAQPGDQVVAIRVKNHAQLSAALSQHEGVLARQMVERMHTVCSMPIFHGDDGIFCWLPGQIEAQTLHEQLEALANLFLIPFEVAGFRVDVGLAFGVENGASTDLSARFASALIAADEAAALGARWKIYDPARLNEAEWTMSLLGQLDAAIDNGEVWVAYQAKFDVRQNRITGAEALARWTHPVRGVIPPDEFIPVAEANGRIHKLTYFVLDQSLALAASMGPDFNIAVNLSAKMFSHPDFVARVSALLAQHHVRPTNLTLEATESATAQSEADMLKTLAALVGLGVCVSIDDYGTGYSTLEYLKKIRASELKIDRGFVATMDRNKSDRLLVNATIKLAHSLGHKVVAEGVETKETLEMLTKMGCDKVQGYYISRPIARADFERFMDEADAQAHSALETPSMPPASAQSAA